MCARLTASRLRASAEAEQQVVEADGEAAKAVSIVMEEAVVAIAAVAAATAAAAAET